MSWIQQERRRSTHFSGVAVFYQLYFCPENVTILSPDKDLRLGETILSSKIEAYSRSGLEKRNWKFRYLEGRWHPFSPLLRVAFRSGFQTRLRCAHGSISRGSSAPGFFFFNCVMDFFTGGGLKSQIAYEPSEDVVNIWTGSLSATFSQTPFFVAWRPAGTHWIKNQHLKTLEKYSINI